MIALTSHQKSFWIGKGLTDGGKAVAIKPSVIAFD
jgi:hypothetical protein